MKKISNHSIGKRLEFLIESVNWERDSRGRVFKSIPFDAMRANGFDVEDGELQRMSALLRYLKLIISNNGWKKISNYNNITIYKP